jgi:hypothetical protein
MEKQRDDRVLRAQHPFLARTGETNARVIKIKTTPNCATEAISSAEQSACWDIWRRRGARSAKRGELIVNSPVGYLLSTSKKSTVWTWPTYRRDEVTIL